jgi:hypothetical protein
MRRLLSLAVTLGLAVGLVGAATVAKKKSTAKKGTAASTHKTAGATKKSSTGTATTKSGKKAGSRSRTTWRNRQLTPTPERYKEIQKALSAKGYLSADQATGKWDDTSTEAMKKFQTDQNLDGNGKINSLSLIALGLGPQREVAAKPAAPSTTP